MIKKKLEDYLRTHTFVKIIDTMMEIEFYIPSYKIHLREIISNLKCYDFLVDHPDFQTMYRVEYIEEINNDLFLKDRNGRVIEIQGIHFKEAKGKKYG